ncbi:hypothetical protein E4U09_004152 [Claviceps aff. purpurea]|uniref:BED-type domain-containing protein n=1 Tax=Claviceps aff. purpurea TaxID=1967640 RepID=A0A9P7U1K1_9HYPO|nr:hypothetical protein E4U09_004152 [Claviceps aff. purpurea]
MERFLYQSAEASSSQSSTQSSTQSSSQPLTHQTTLSLGLSSSLELSSSPPPPTAMEKGKGKAKLTGDVYDVHLAPPSIHRSAGKDILSNDSSTFTYQGKMYIRDKVINPMDYANRSSIAWVYGEGVREGHPRSTLLWYCYYCERDNRGQGLPKADGGFKTRHLMDIHGYDKDTKTFISKVNNRNPAGVSTPLLCRTDLFRKNLINFFIRSHSSFFMIENESFRQLIECSGMDNRDLLLCMKTLKRVTFMD